MGRNSGKKENLISIILIGFIMAEIAVAFFGLFKFEGFLAEGQIENTDALGLVGEILSLPFARFVHLSMLPVIVALAATTVERIPFLRKNIQGATLSPLNQLLITFINYTIQLLPAIVGYKVEGKLVSATWLSDFTMVPWGYAALSFLFVSGLIIGLIYVVLGYFLVDKKTRAKTSHKPLLYSLGIIILSILSFTGAGLMLGFLAEYGVTSLDEYGQKHGYIFLFYKGPFTRFARLIFIPALAGSILFLYTIIKKGKLKAEPIQKISLFAFITMFLQIIPAILFGTNPTLISDTIIENGGYIILAGAYFAAIFLGLYRSLTGNLLHQFKT